MQQAHPLLTLKNKPSILTVTRLVGDAGSSDDEEGWRADALRVQVSDDDLPVPERQQRLGLGANKRRAVVIGQ